MDVELNAPLIGIVAGSTRPNRKSADIARWVRHVVDDRTDVTTEVVDLADHALPHLDETWPATMARYERPHTRAWADVVARYDGFVFVTPEYNHSIPGVLKDALDFVYAEWNNKAAGFVGYGAQGGARAVEQMRMMMAELQIADVRAQVCLYLHTDFENQMTLVPTAHHQSQVHAMFDQLVPWTLAMRSVRAADTPRSMTPTHRWHEIAPASSAHGREGAAGEWPSIYTRTPLKRVAGEVAQ